jgi:hypothetical protein
MDINKLIKRVELEFHNTTEREKIAIAGVELIARQTRDALNRILIDLDSLKELEEQTKDTSNRAIEPF